MRLSLKATVTILTIAIGVVITILVSHDMVSVRGYRAVGGEIMIVPLLLELEYIAFEIITGIIEILKEAGSDDEDDFDDYE